MSNLAVKLIEENKRTKRPFLDLGNCGLEYDIPKQIIDCKGWLRRINLGDSYFNYVKKERVYTTNSSNKNIFNGPELVLLRELDNLEAIDLSNTQANIRDFTFLEKIQKLNKLDFSNNRGDIFFLKKLTKLNHLLLSSNSLKDANFIENLHYLKTLDLRNNYITDFNFLKYFTHLEYLDIGYNRLWSTDTSFAKHLPKLKSFSIASNKLHSLDIIENLENLEYLDVSDNQISELNFIDKCTNLESLNISRNQISNLSPIEALKKLSTLDISHNRTWEYEVLGKLPSLESLNISNNETWDDKFLENLPSMKALYLNNFQVRSYNFLEKFNNLQTLFLVYNQITDISFLKHLTNIQVLNLSRNQITDASPLNQLINLKSLTLNGNDISNTSFLNKLVNLEFLDLSFNEVTDISRFENLVNLHTLDLSNNRINSIRPLLNLLKKDLKIDLFGKYSYSHQPILHGEIGLSNNPIKNPPKEIMSYGNEAIIRYFEKIDQEGKDFIYEAKLTLVGEGGAGKTSLQRKILDENATLPTGEDRTRGIKVHDWEFNDVESSSYKAHIWDFGGQDVYYPVHRFFLTENAVYILLASTRYSNHNFEYWIPTIYQFGGSSPIVLVQNQDNGHQKDWDDLNLFYQITNYNLCKPYHRINLLSPDTIGLKKLRTFIEQQIIQLPHIGKPVPKSWVRVREALIEKAKQTDCISFEKFIDLCHEIDSESFKKLIDIEDLGRFFHDLGVILWYSKKTLLKNLVILKPEWAMNAVYKIIDDVQIQEQKGIIHQSDFERIWSEPTYHSKINELKLMLEVFKIAFPKKHQKEDYIIPARLLPISDENRWKNTEQLLRLEYHFDFMPRGIVNQISAELSKSIMSDDSVWNNAVIIKNHDSEAQIIEEYNHRKIYIKTQGRDARALTLMIKDSVENIISEYRGVVPLLKVPCNCKKCQNLDKPTLFEYEDLVDYIGENRQTVTCNKSATTLDIYFLLYSVGLKQNTGEIYAEITPISNIIPKKQPEIFFSYAWDKLDEKESREKIVRELYECLKTDGLKVVIDKEDLDYTGSITEFMNRIGEGDLIVVAISDSYLKSINCMYEFYEIYKNSKQNRELMRSRIFPIRVETIKLNNPQILDGYFEYWESLEKEWEELIRKRGHRIGESQQKKYKRIKAIASELGDFLDFLSDINSKSKEEISKNNFTEIIDLIKSRL